jgi:hypothetical protein
MLNFIDLFAGAGACPKALFGQVIQFLRISSRVFGVAQIYVFWKMRETQYEKFR